MARETLFAKDMPKEHGMFVRQIYDRKDKVTKRPGVKHIVMKFPRQELVDELTEQVRAWLQTRGVWLIVIKQDGGQDGHE